MAAVYGGHTNEFINDNLKTLLVQEYLGLKFLDEEDVLNELKCVRCARVAINHYFATCGHLFCKNCKRVLEYGKGGICPKCKKHITQITRQDEGVERKVASLQVNCLNLKYGCQTITSLKDLNQHLKECKNTKESCLPAMYQGANAMDAVMNQMGKLSIEMQNMQVQMVLSQKESEEKLLSQIVTYDDERRKDVDQKFQKLENRIKGLRLDFNMDRTRYGTAKYDSQNAGDSEMFRQMFDQIISAERVTEEKISILSKEVSELRQYFDAMKNVEQHHNEKSFINILLLGESGSGKSTIINTFASQCRYKIFEEAKEGNAICLIPTQINIQDTYRNYQTVIVGKSNSNEGTGEHGSRTQSCQSYVFNLNNSLSVRWIDSPGFSSKQGPQRNDEKVADILNYISQYEDIHVIVIVMNGTVSKLTKTMEQYFRQILTMFHKKATQNIIFIFTNCEEAGKATGFQILKKILEKLENDSFKLGIDRNKIYSFQNDAFRTYMAMKNGIEVEEDKLGEASEIWYKSVIKFQDLLDYVQELEPHDVSETLSIDYVNTLVENITLLLNHVSTKRKNDQDDNPNPNDDHFQNDKAEELQQLEDAIAKFNSYIVSNAIFKKSNQNQSFIMDDSCHQNLSDETQLSTFDTNDEQVSLKDIQTIKTQLFLMQHYGDKFKRICDETQLSKKIRKNREKLIHVDHSSFTLKK